MLEYTIGFLIGVSMGIVGYYFIPKIWIKVKAWIIIKLT